MNILNARHRDGYRADPRAVYSLKYRAAVLQLIIIAELGVDAKDDRVRKACVFILNE